MLPRRIDLCSSSTSSSSAHKYGRAESLGVRQQASARALRSRLCELRERESPRASPVRHLFVWLTGPGQQASARAVAIPPLPATVIYLLVIKNKQVEPNPKSQRREHFFQLNI